MSSGPLRSQPFCSKDWKSLCDTCLMPGKKAGQLIPKHMKCSLLISSSHWAAHVYQASMVCRTLFVGYKYEKWPVSPSWNIPMNPKMGSEKLPHSDDRSPFEAAASPPAPECLQSWENQHWFRGLKKHPNNRAASLTHGILTAEDGDQTGLSNILQDLTLPEGSLPRLLHATARCTDDT